MEQKIKKCGELGRKDRISYKFLAGDNAVDEIATKVKNNDYDLVILASANLIPGLDLFLVKLER